MAIIMNYINPEVTDISGYNYLAEFRYGSNGEAYSDTEVLAGTNDNVMQNRVTWDTNPFDGVDSGWGSVNMVFQQGLLGFQVGNSEVADTQVGAFNTIDHIVLRAGVFGAGDTMDWKNISVNFFKDGQLVEVFDPGTLSAQSSDSTGMGEQYLDIRASDPGVNSFSISAQVKMTSPEGNMPWSDEMFSQVLIYTA